MTRPRSKLGIEKSAGALEQVLQQLNESAGGGVPTLSIKRALDTQ